MTSLIPHIVATIAVPAHAQEIPKSNDTIGLGDVIEVTIAQVQDAFNNPTHDFSIYNTAQKKAKEGGTISTPNQPNNKPKINILYLEQDTKNVNQLVKNPKGQPIQPIADDPDLNPNDLISEGVNNNSPIKIYELSDLQKGVIIESGKKNN